MNYNIYTLVLTIILGSCPILSITLFSLISTAFRFGILVD